MVRTLQRQSSSRRTARAALIAMVAATALATILLVEATPARAQVSADINIRLGNRPAPVVVFDEEPEVVLVPRSRVYYVEHRGYDLYRYGRYWYINDNGYWFRASGYRGPFVGVELRHVPRSITVVPDRYRHHPIYPSHPHGGPPGQLKKHRSVAHYDDVRFGRNGFEVHDSKGDRKGKGGKHGKHGKHGKGDRSRDDD